MIDLKTIIIAAGLIVSLVGISSDKWKTATIGSTIAIVGILVGGFIK
jgi:type IV secretory pathway TrbD component